MDDVPEIKGGLKDCLALSKKWTVKETHKEIDVA